MKREQMSEQERDERIAELYRRKNVLLDKHGIFGGGIEVNRQHYAINLQLEDLGIGNDGQKIDYQTWVNN